MSFFSFKSNQMQMVPTSGEGENMPRRYDTIYPILSDRKNRSKYVFYDENKNNLGEIEDIGNQAVPGVGAEYSYHFSNARDRIFNDMSPLFVKGPPLKIPPVYGVSTPVYDSPTGGKKSRRRRGGKRRKTRKGGRKSRRSRRY